MANFEFLNNIWKKHNIVVKSKGFDFAKVIQSIKAEAGTVNDQNLISIEK